MTFIFGISLSFLAQLGPKPLFSHKPGGEWSKQALLSNQFTTFKEKMQQVLENNATPKKIFSPKMCCHNLMRQSTHTGCLVVK